MYFIKALFVMMLCGMIMMLITTSLLTSTIATASSSLSSATVKSSSKLTTTTSSTTRTNSEDNIIFKRVLVQIVHRHGDRTPITPMKDEKYWSEKLIPSSTYNKIGNRTVVERRHDAHRHPAKGRGPFGKLTERGWDQLIQLGSSIRNELIRYNHDEEDGGNNILTSDRTSYFSRLIRMDHGDNDKVSSNDTSWWLDPHIFSNDDAIWKNVSRHIQVYSTDFERTIQSVQAFLYGFLSSSSEYKTNFFDDEREDDVDNNNKNIIVIDTKYSDLMIPDPVPRSSQEQIDLEHELVSRSHISQRDAELYPIASRLSRLLRPHLAHDAHEASFGAPEVQKKGGEKKDNCDDANKVLEDDDGDDCIEIQPLSWNQLAEITKCLQSYDLIQQYNLSNDDCDAIQRHVAWKWSELYSHPRLLYLSMNPIVRQQIKIMLQYVGYHTRRQAEDKGYNNGHHEPPPPLMTIWSAHDSTLIGLLGAYRLQRLQSKWPGYASYLMMELLQKVIVTDNNNNNNTCTTDNDPIELFYVRFTFNGDVLSSKWEQQQPHETSNEEPLLDDNKMMMIIPLSQLQQNIYNINGLESSS